MASSPRNGQKSRLNCPLFGITVSVIWTACGLIMTKTKKNIRDLQKELATPVNPFVEDVKEQLQTIEVPTGRKQEVMSMRTGEQGDAQFYNRKRVDRQVFMRDYSSVVDRKLGLSRTAKNVKSAIAEVYQETVSASGKRLAMSADLVHLHFFDGGISGLDVGMSERTFRRGLKELLEKE